MILGTASATLIGAMFVVVSIGSGFLTRERAIGIRTFLTSTVVNLSATLSGAALTMVPALDWLWLGGIVGVAGIAGLVYSLREMLGFNQHPGTDRSDCGFGTQSFRSSAMPCCWPPRRPRCAGCP